MHHSAMLWIPGATIRLTEVALVTRATATERKSQRSLQRSHRLARLAATREQLAEVSPAVNIIGVMSCGRAQPLLRGCFAPVAHSDDAQTNHR